MNNYNVLIRLVTDEVKDTILSLSNPKQREKDSTVQNIFILSVYKVFGNAQKVFQKPEYNKIYKNAIANPKSTQKISGATLFSLLNEIYK